MGKKKPDTRRPEHPVRKRPAVGEGRSLAAVIGGPQAKWLFFGIYLIVTIILFREFIFSNDMLFGSDTIPDGIYTRRYYKEYHEQYGGIPRWNPFILGGLPFIDAMHGDTFYPAAWLKFVMPLTRALGYKLILHVFLAGLSMYFFLRTLKMRREAAFIGGLVYMLAPSFVSWVYGGHDAKMYVIALLPLAFAFLEAGMRRPLVRYFVLLGAVMGLMILSSHVQMAYYAYWAIGLYFLFRLFMAGIPGDTVTFSPPDMLRKTGLFVMAVVVALTLGAVQLLPAYRFTTTQSVRSGEMRTGYEYATSWSMHPEEVAGMIMPDFPGMNSVDTHPEPQHYWGRNPFKLNTEYHGVIPLVFGLLALFFVRERWRWFYLGLAALSLVYALGANTPVFRLFYELVPGVKNFRAPSMIIFLFCFSFVVLASAFISSLLEGRTLLREGDRRLVWTVGIAVVAGVVVSAWGRGFFEAWAGVFWRSIPDSKAAAFAANVPYFIRDLWRGLLIFSVALLGCWMYLSKRIGALAFAILIAFAALIDGVSVDSRFITTLNPDLYPGYTAPDQSVVELQKRLLESPMPFRVLGMFSGKQGANYYAMFGIQAVDGMHNNELESYEQFRGGSQSANLTRHWVADGALEPSGLTRNNFLNVAGVRFILLADGQGGSQLFENEFALPRAFVVHDYRPVETDEAAVKALAEESLDPARTVIVTGRPDIPADPTVEGSRVISYKPFNRGYRVTARFAAPGMLVLTENHVPYWNAAIDGVPAQVFTAYGTFMAVPCPAGEHTVTFTFRSEPYETGRALTLLSLGFITLLLAITGIREIRERGKKRR
ncbi:hypothetical protein ACFL55_00040 [Candidatus Latescibacterota bacterium]